MNKAIIYPQAMNRKNFFLFFLLQWLFWAALKVLLFNYQIFANPGTQQIVFWILTAVIAAFVIRRFGPISFFEMGLVVIFWTAASLLLDLIVASKFTGLGLFSVQAFWDSYGIMIATVFLFHKKRHVYIRHKMQAAKHHADVLAAAQHSQPQMPEVKRP